MGGSELIGKEERDAVEKVLMDGVPFRYGFDEKRKGAFKVAEFERRFADYVGSKYALAVSSGSAALRVALAGLDVGKGDEIITQAFTFVATVEAIIACGASPVLCEVDKTLNLDPADLEKKITDKTRVIIPVHMLGAPARLDEIMEIARRHKLIVLEDSCQACGSSYKGRKTGTLGMVGASSFDYVKTITTGEGGMLVTDDEEFYLRASEYHDHGHKHNPDVPRGKDGKSIVGFNYRMNDIQGAIGVVQLDRLDFVLSQQRKNKAAIKDAIGDIGCIEFREITDEEGDGADTLIFFLPDKEKAERVEDSLTKDNIPTKILPSALGWHFAGCWTHISADYSPSLWPKTDKLLNRAIAIPISVKMADADINEIIAAIHKAAKV